MSNDITFQPWPKTPRWSKDIIITEKIDGTNAAIGIKEVEPEPGQYHPANVIQVDLAMPSDEAEFDEDDVRTYWVYAQSRKRIITPGSDNFGFAAWAWDNAATLAADLGPGLHFGEWWGRGIQRGYDLDHRRFSLFNVSRWEETQFDTPNVYTVPVLYDGPNEVEFVYKFDGGYHHAPVEDALRDLKELGSYANPFYSNPEGIIIYHTASRQVYKKTFEDGPKTVANQAALAVAA